jgi:hypothetical protein
MTHIDYYIPSIRSNIAHNMYKLPDIVYSTKKTRDTSNIRHIIIFINDISNLVRSSSTFTVITLAIKSWTATYIDHYIPHMTLVPTPLRSCYHHASTSMYSILLTYIVLEGVCWEYGVTGAGICEGKERKGHTGGPEESGGAGGGKGAQGLGIGPTARWS